MKPKKKEVVDGRKALLRKLIFTKLMGIRREKFEPKTIDKFSLVFRVFLLRYLNLNYEFTLDELVKELNKIKISTELKDRITALSTLLVEIEYEDKKISKEEFKSLLSEAERIVNLATGQVEKEKKIEKKEEKAHIKKNLLFNFLRKIKLIKTEEEKKAIKKEKEEREEERQRLKAAREQEMLRAKEEEKKQIEAEKKREEAERKKVEKERIKIPIILPPPLPFPDIEVVGLGEARKKRKIKPLDITPKVEKKIDEVKLIKEKIHKARIMVWKSKLNDAKRTYIGIMKTYILLEPKEQAEVYNDIKKLYHERKGKEKLKRIK